MKFLDLSGYMFSGKSAVSDILREHSGFLVPNYRLEFDLLRVPHGLIDLKHALVDNWSWLRSDKAIREFMELAVVLNRKPVTILEKVFKPGFGYSAIYKDFDTITSKFINSITVDRWVMQLPYDLVFLGLWRHAKLKILSKLTGVYGWPNVEYQLSSGANFQSNVKTYLHEVLTSGLDLKNTHTVVTHNMLEPYDPSVGCYFFDDIKSIVVDRDVRDIYMTATSYSHGFNDFVPMYSRILGAFDVNLFINRQAVLRNRTNFDCNEHIMRICFEDLVFKYENSCDSIRKFLGITPSEHHLKGVYFDPAVSEANVGLWRKAEGSQLRAISQIEKHLPELCIQ